MFFGIAATSFSSYPPCPVNGMWNCGNFLCGIYCLSAFRLSPFTQCPLPVISVFLQMIPLRVFEPGVRPVHEVDDFFEDKVMYLFLLGDLQKRRLFIFIL